MEYIQSTTRFDCPQQRTTKKQPKKKTNLRKHLIPILLACAALYGPAYAASDPSATEIVDRADTLVWGKTMQGDMEMIITTPSWSRTMEIKLWQDRPTRSFARIVAPAKDAGILSLRIATEMWNYMPTIERTIKIPPSMMLQPWLGSDFTNDDMVKESSTVNDYTHRLVAQKKEGDVDVYEIESLPKPNVAVVWGKLNMIIRKSDFVPLKTGFFNERGELVRTITYSDIKQMDGRMIPTRWTMQPLDKPGKSTTIVVKSVQYDKPIANDVFSLQNLGRGR